MGRSFVCWILDIATLPELLPRGYSSVVQYQTSLRSGTPVHVSTARSSRSETGKEKSTNLIQLRLKIGFCVWINDTVGCRRRMWDRIGLEQVSLARFHISTRRKFPSLPWCAQKILNVAVDIPYRFYAEPTFLCPQTLYAWVALKPPTFTSPPVLSVSADFERVG
ncbi:uncharacterized protein QC761_108878 [Podospora bellae-mahoneyi]|uniref:Uncharacterized protein n=1 Tax=Podospora bellae-mahoneyi TaxID=2093777 RepID=A0ABR0FYK0_9PEZI|nr:hypothetical protein QC761_108878 [Podospora bellae-mahoneyi]